MKLIIFVALTAGILQVNAGKKLALITGLNGGLVTGLNPGIAVAGINPGIAVAGRLIAQPQIAQVLPFMQRPAIPVIPNFALPQQQQFPRQGVSANAGQPYYMGTPPNTFPQQGGQQGANPGQQQPMPSNWQGQPYYMGAQTQNTLMPQQRVNPDQQQTMGTPGRVGGDVRPQEDSVLGGPIKRYRRSRPRRVCVEAENEDPSDIAPTPIPTDAQPIPELLRMD
ncbi:hypothetical protein AGOR_G00232980 [Albula goreensis]|uniref:Secretory calcium-binding phosphoprotein 9 n=1 Tax=Albula goreensis TaxID=1534307 RepID=A0A8T3CKE6_9TELE|nr:hypothetical protein AGOR_G00232980 [Albula goreensis]